VLAVEAKRDYFISEIETDVESNFSWTPLTIELILEERSSMGLQTW